MSYSSRHKKVATAVVALGLGVTLALTSCSSAKDADVAGDELTGELRILANITPVLTKAYYEDLVAPYVEAHPGVTVSIEVPSNTNVQNTFQQELASGDVPDIIASNLEAVVIPELVTFPEEDWVNETPLASENKVDGKSWQVSTGQQIKSLVYYNKTAFEEAGISTLPSTVDEFTATLEKLKDAGYVGLQTAGEWVTGTQFSMLAEPIVLGEDPNWFAERTAGDVSFEQSAFDTYLKAYESWLEEGTVPKESLGLKYQESIDSFASGKSATFIMGNWVVPSIDQAAPSFEVGVFPTPTLDGSLPKQLSGVAQPYSIPKGSKNQALALDLVKYLVTDDVAIEKALVSEGNFRSGFVSESSPLGQEVADVFEGAPGFVVEPPAQMLPGYRDEINEVVQSLYVGTTADEAAQTLDNWWTQNALN